jgi:S-adenosylmethionine synthetase
MFIMKCDFVFSSESVTEGHPDKLCDRISDALVGQYLRRDRLARINVECAVSTGILFVAVKAASTAAVDIPFASREVIREAGYDRDGFNARDCTVMTSLSELDVPLAMRIDEDLLSDEDLEAVPARDQVTVFGFACTQTDSLMPLPIWLAHRLARRLSEVRRAGSLPYLLPDGKTQVAVEFRDRQPRRIHSVTILAAQRDADSAPAARLRTDILEAVVAPTFADERLRPDRDTRIDINPEGPVIGGGPATHSGLTGRKTAVDTYGEYARHSGAALSGKDPSRIDRTGAYAARYAAKNIVAAGLARECEVQLSYSVGGSRPVSVHVETFGTCVMDEDELEERVRRTFDFRPAAITRDLRLRRLPGDHPDGFYVALAAYGHMGRTDLGLPWEETDRAVSLR